MSREPVQGTDKSAGLLSFLNGAWTTRLTAYAHSDLVEAKGLHVREQFGSLNLDGFFRELPEGGVGASYRLIQEPAGTDGATIENIIYFRLDRSENVLVASVQAGKPGPEINGVWFTSGVSFRGDFHDDVFMWELFKAICPHVTTRPSTFSIIVHKASEVSWLLDVAFRVQQTYPSPDAPIDLLCRLEFWHFRAGVGAPPPAHPQAVEELFERVSESCDAVTQDVEFRIDEIDALISSLENRRMKCEEQLRLLGELKSDAGSGKDDVDSLNDELQDALHQWHDESRLPPASPPGAGGFEIVAGTWSELVSRHGDAESLEARVDSIEADVDPETDALIDSSWTNVQYARGRRLLRENRTRLPPPDLGFLGPLQTSVCRLSKAAARIVNTSSVLVQIALSDESEGKLDCGPQIASMAKACERILADAFAEKRDAIGGDPLLRSLLFDDRNWQYRIPADMFKVAPSDLVNVVKLTKKSIEAGASIKWNGMGQKRHALLLFGGWIPIYHAAGEHVVNPLNIDRSAPHVQLLPGRLGDFLSPRNGFIHHDLAGVSDVKSTWECYQDCLEGLLEAFYFGSE